LFLAALAFTASVPIFAQTPPPQPAPASLEGIVRDASGHPVPNASVSLAEQNGAKTAETATKVDGTFAFSALHAGAFTIKAEKVGTRDSAEQSLELSAGEKKHVALVLKTPTSASAATPSPASPNSAPDKMEFSDQPNFTVAGMTDWSNLGLHGSDATTRTSEALTKETLALKSSTAHESAANSAGDVATVHRLSGDRDERSGDPVAAVHEYEQAAHLDPSEENYFAWGSELLLHRAAQPAAEVFTKGAALHPKSARMLAGLGAALYEDGLYDEAARRVCSASDLNPADPAPYLFLGKMQETANNALPCVEEKLVRFAGTQPENAMANYYYGVSIWKRERRSELPANFRDAETLFKKAAALDPALADAYLQLGFLYFVQGDFQKTKQVLQQATAINPQLGEAHFELGQAYRRMGENAKAEQEFAIFKQCEKTEADALDRQRRELRQFLVILKDQPQPPQPK
jgi:tetratricopeptide (TPR) repeat protein